MAGVARADVALPVVGEPSVPKLLPVGALSESRLLPVGGPFVPDTSL